MTISKVVMFDESCVFVASKAREGDHVLHQRALAIAARELVRRRMGNALAACTPPRKDGYDE